MIPKRYCIDFDSDVEKVEAKIEGNKISCQDIGTNFYKIYIWQQLLINELLKEHDTVILEVEYVDSEYTKTLEIKSKFKISKDRGISRQCLNCKERIECKNFQQALTEDYILSIDNPEKLYNTYVAVGGKMESLKGIHDDLRKIIDEKIEKDKGKLVLGKMGLTLSIKEIQKDEFPFDVALKNNLLNDKNCKIKIGEMKKTIQGTDYIKQLKKVPWQKRLNIE